MNDSLSSKRLFGASEAGVDSSIVAESYREEPSRRCVDQLGDCVSGRPLLSLFSWGCRGESVLSP